MIANPFQSFMSRLQAPSYTPGPMSVAPKQGTPKPGPMSVTPAAATPVTGAPAATSPVSPAVAPASLKTPAAQTYMSNQMGGGDTLQNFKTANPGVTPNSQDYAIMGGANPPTQSDPYTTYLSSLFNPEQLKTSKGLVDSYGSKINDATNSLYGIQNEQLSRKVSGAHDYQNTLDESGGLLGGAQQSAAMSARRSNAELADLAVQESAKANTLSALTGARKNAQDTYDQMIGAGKSVYEAKQAADKVAAANAFQERKFNEDVRQYGMDYALKVKTENRVASNANKPAAATKQDYISSYVSAFTPGTAEYKTAQQNLGGIPPTDANGYITPEAFKAAAQEAGANGISRKEFIELIGSQLYSDPKSGVPDPEYGLTQVEKKLIGVKA